MAYTVTTVPSTALPEHELGNILTDYCALDEVRVFRRLLVTRFGLLALAAALVGTLVPGLPMTARWLPTVLFLAAPLWAWVHEIRLECRLSNRLEGVTGVETREVSLTFELDDC